MTRSRIPTLMVFCLLMAMSRLAACQNTTPTARPTPTITLAPPVTPTATATAVSHPELDVISPYNVARIQQIGQWGQGNVSGIALSPDGNLFAVSTTTGIYLYDRRTVKQVDYIDIRVGANIDIGDCPNSGNLAFSPDGSMLAIAYTDITLWDLGTHVPRTVVKNKIQSPDSIISGIQFSRDGRSIIGIQKQASGYPCYSGWGSLVIYRANSGEMVFRKDYIRSEVEPDPVFAEKDGAILISYLDAQKKEDFLLEVNLRSGKVLSTRESPSISSMNNTAAVTNKWISPAPGGGVVERHLVDLTSFQVIEELTAVVQLIPQSDKMIFLEQQKLSVRTVKGEIICSKPIAHQATNAFLPDQFSLDGSIAISWDSYGDRAGDVRIWDLKQCTISDPVLILPEPARQLSFSSDGRSVVTGSRAGYTFYVFDAESGRLRFSLSGFDAKFSADGKQVFVVEAESVDAFDVGTGKYLYSVLKFDSNYMTSILVSPNGQSVVLFDGSTRNFRLFRIGENSAMDQPPDRIEGDPYLSQDGRLVAAIKGRTAASEIRFWELGTGNELWQWRGMVPGDGLVGDATFNSDFSQLATIATDGYYQYVYIWNIPSFSLAKALTQSFPSGKRPIYDPKFTPNSQVLCAHASSPDAFLFWDLVTGKLVSEVPDGINGSELGNPVVFSPDGRLLAVLDGDGTIHVWGVRQ